MRNSLFQHQAIEYPPGQPFWAGIATEADADYIYVKSSHWHEDLEIAYVKSGHSYHYIDGKRIEATPGSLVVTNCESIHHIQACPEDIQRFGTAYVVVLLVNRRYLEGVFPALRRFRFNNDQVEADVETGMIMEGFAGYSKVKTHPPHETLIMQSQLLQLIASLLEHRAAEYEPSTRKSTQMETFKDILRYVDSHYREPITQAQVAKLFFFTPQYFSRLFKRCTGRTFLEHLTAVRLEQARSDLLYSDRLVKEIAKDNGFADDKSFILAFKKAYAVTPLQYKKQMVEHPMGGDDIKG